jgi:hypothetical protein
MPAWRPVTTDVGTEGRSTKLSASTNPTGQVGIGKAPDPSGVNTTRTPHSPKDGQRTLIRAPRNEPQKTSMSLVTVLSRTASSAACVANCLP